MLTTIDALDGDVSARGVEPDVLAEIGRHRAYAEALRSELDRGAARSPLTPARTAATR